MKKILFPLNFTPSAFNALEWACQLAVLHNGSILMLHVIPEGEYRKMYSGPTEKKERVRLNRLELESRLNRLCEEVRKEFPDLGACRVELAGGSLVDEIHAYSKKEQCDLIVMGNEGVQDAIEAMDGNSLVKVIEQASCPVLCVPYKASVKEINQVVYATDFKEGDEETLRQLTLFLEPAGSTLDVLHLQDAQLSKGAKEKNNQRLDRLLENIAYPRLQSHLVETTEDIPLALNNFITESGADLLVLLTHQRNFLERILQESVFKQLSYFAQYPLLIFLQEQLPKNKP